MHSLEYAHVHGFESQGRLINLDEHPLSAESLVSAKDECGATDPLPLPHPPSSFLKFVFDMVCVSSTLPKAPDQLSQILMSAWGWWCGIPRILYADTHCTRT